MCGCGLQLGKIYIPWLSHYCLMNLLVTAFAPIVPRWAPWQEMWRQETKEYKERLRNQIQLRQGYCPSIPPLWPPVGIGFGRKTTPTGQRPGFRAGSGGSPSPWDPGGPNDTAETGRRSYHQFLTFYFFTGLNKEQRKPRPQNTTELKALQVQRLLNTESSRIIF